jgi:hypothetical protein
MHGGRQLFSLTLLMVVEGVGVFLHRQNIGWSKSHVPVLRWFCELQSIWWSILVQPLLRGNSPRSSGLILKMNRCYKGRAEGLRSSHGEGENVSHTPCLKSRGPFIGRAVAE